MTRVDLGPDDSLVVHYPMSLSAEQAQRIRQHLTDWVEQGAPARVLVLTDGATLSVLHRVKPFYKVVVKHDGGNP